jgi:hypothetical protein
VTARRLAAVLTLAMSLAAGSGAAVQAAECRLALLLALDVSSSVDPEEDLLQRGGVVSALRSDAVRAAFFASDQPVALAIYEWSGRHNQKIVLDWVLIDSPETLVAAADIVAASTRSHSEYPTAMGYAMGYGAGMLGRAPDCLARTIDVSGDGQNNEGFGPRIAYREFGFAETTVNGLVVNAADFEGEVGLIAFYRSEVLHGPGAFLVVAEGFGDYARAMTAKLVREVSPLAISALPVDAGRGG